MTNARQSVCQKPCIAVASDIWSSSACKLTIQTDHSVSPHVTTYQHMRWLQSINVYLFCKFDMGLLIEPQFEEGDASNPAGNHSCLTVHLNSPLSKGKSVDLSKYTVHTDLMAPFPKQASQSDPQRVLMSGNAYASSPYSISTQTTKVSCLCAQ